MPAGERPPAPQLPEGHSCPPPHWPLCESPWLPLTLPGRCVAGAAWACVEASCGTGPAVTSQNNCCNSFKPIYFQVIPPSSAITVASGIGNPMTSTEMAEGNTRRQWISTAYWIKAEELLGFLRVQLSSRNCGRGRRNGGHCLCLQKVTTELRRQETHGKLDVKQTRWVT